MEDLIATAAHRNTQASNEGGTDDEEGTLRWMFDSGADVLIVSGVSSERLAPIVEGQVRSAFAMTEPGLPSSDAKNISTQAVLEGDEWVINGEKYYISGAGDPRCKIMITMVVTNPDAAPHKRQSQILVPIPSPGLEILGGRPISGHLDLDKQVAGRSRRLRGHRVRAGTGRAAGALTSSPPPHPAPRPNPPALASRKRSRSAWS